MSATWFMEAIAVILSAAESKSLHTSSLSGFSWIHQEWRSQLWITQREWKQQEGGALQEIAKDIMDLRVFMVCVIELLMPWKLHAHVEWTNFSFELATDLNVTERSQDSCVYKSVVTPDPPLVNGCKDSPTLPKKSETEAQPLLEPHARLTFSLRVFVLCTLDAERSVWKFMEAIN